MTGLPAGRGARTAVAAVGLLVLVLVAVLVGLLGPSGSDAGPDPAGTTSVRPAGRASTGPSARSSRRPTAPSTATATNAGGRDPRSGLPLVALGQLPPEARQTVALIDRGGPFPYAKDGVTFGNNEGLLPAHPRGWYREYTVRTPGEGDRGPRRIVTGDDDREIYYTGDHYVTFARVTR